MLLLGMAAGCGPKPPPPAGPSPVPPAPPGGNAPEARKPGPARPQPAKPQPAKPQPLSGTAAGPVKLGMAPEAVRAIPDAVVREVDLGLEGTPSPALRVERDGRLRLIAELEKGKVWRIRVFTPEFRTAAGARVGTPAAELEKLYGPGTLVRGEGNTCATFKKAPGLSFCFSPGSMPDLKTWKDVVRRGLGVTAIMVVGSG